MVPQRFVDALSDIKDPRVERTKRHALVDVLVIAVIAVINDCKGWHDMELFAKARLPWLRTFLNLENGVPSEDTFRRVFEAIDPKAFNACIATILSDLTADLKGKVVAIDGKTMRGSFDKRRGLSSLHVVSAWASELGIALGQICVAEKSNEITAIPELVKTLDLRGATVTIDAMGCQKEIASAIVDAGADYVLSVKDNHPKLHATAVSAFTDPEGADDTSSVTSEHTDASKGHGRTEERRVRIVDDITWAEGIKAWKGARCFVEVRRKRTAGGKTSVERAYFISSLKVDAETMGHRIRQHWGVENSLHWVLDVTFDEDRSRVRDRNAAANLTATRKLTASLIKRVPLQRSSSIASGRKCAGWMPDYAFTVLAAIHAE
jgi:predicted transposase YbfD/YdcC